MTLDDAIQSLRAERVETIVREPGSRFFTIDEMSAEQAAQLERLGYEVEDNYEQDYPPRGPERLVGYMVWESNFEA